MNYILRATENAKVLLAYNIVDKIKQDDELLVSESQADIIKYVSEIKQKLIKNKVPKLIWPTLILIEKYTSTDDLITAWGGPLTTEEAAKKYLQYIEYTVSPEFEPWEMGSEDLPTFQHDAIRQGFFPNDFNLEDYDNTVNINYDDIPLSKPKKKTTRNSHAKK